MINKFHFYFIRLVEYKLTHLVCSTQVNNLFSLRIKILYYFHWILYCEKLRKKKLVDSFFHFIQVSIIFSCNVHLMLLRSLINAHIILQR